MSDFSGEPWSDKPNAPQISSWMHTAEQELIAGAAIGNILNGVVVVLFFQCIGALISPVNNISKSVKWGLVVHTVALFLFLTIPAAINRYLTSIGYIDGRNFPGTDDTPPGPFGYGYTFAPSVAIMAIHNVMFPMNQWLTDGLLLYRCYIIYSMNYWAVAFPCLLFLASIAIGIMYIYTSSMTTSDYTLLGAYMDTSYTSISFSLNLLLTLMIIARLILHSRNLRHAIGAAGGATGLYATVVTMLVESYALYAVALLLYIVSWNTRNSTIGIISRAVGPIQVIAPYLIVIRVAKRRALTSEMITSGSEKVGSIQFRSQGTTDTNGSLPDGGPTNTMQANNEVPNNVGTANGIEEVPL